MSDVADYETDILLWSERQAELLRGLKGVGQGLPNELDLENVAEEIESVGRTEFRAFESCLVQIFIHLMKAASNPDPMLRGKWEDEIFGFQREALKAMSPSMLARLDLDDTWKYARVKAKIELARYHERLDASPLACPFAVELFLVKEPLDLEPLLDVMREQADRETGSK
ncbi:DUF29 domain-containing protein [Methylopila sp. M107]|uniref:DUF29 domain-containing protein n=1 Tax=Methylopila sp. M107 TaxID=1101190 RepID=UPI0012DFACD2|nr:DUF29 domain-containing protein [Methylopila sp. M107]